MAATPTLTAAQRRARLARRHRLLPADRTDDVAVIAEDLLGLHSTDPVTVYLSALARMRHPSLAAVDAALYTDRTVLRHHAMRRTLWVATAATMRRMHATTTARYAATEHRRMVGLLEGNGIADGEEWLVAAKRDVLELLRAAGPMTARELGQRIPALAHPLRLSIGKPYEGVQAAHSRVLLQLGFEGSLVRTRPVGSWISGQYTWAAMDTWLPGGVHGPDGAPLPERESARDLARHWLHRFGPGTSADLQWWMGWTATTTRRALAEAEAVAVDLDGVPGWVAPEDLEPAPTEDAGEPGEPWVAVLPGLDPTTMGWKERSWYLPPAAADAFDRNGNGGPTVWVDGEVVAGWVQARDGAIRLCWFTDVPAARRAQVLARVEEVRDWLGEVRFSVRFPAPYAKGLQV
ncbi:MAG: winged helix DNA-binding domain-containing protein [Kineosporiaceae bacterium]